MSQLTEMNALEVYIITIRNMRMRSVIVKNIYLHFGDKNQGDFFIGYLNRNSELDLFAPSFPERLDQGESMDYYLMKDRLAEEFNKQYKGKLFMDAPLRIRIDEVTTGTTYYKTKLRFNNFVKRCGRPAVVCKNQKFVERKKNEAVCFKAYFIQNPGSVGKELPVRVCKLFSGKEAEELCKSIEILKGCVHNVSYSILRRKLGFVILSLIRMPT